MIDVKQNTNALYIIEVKQLLLDEKKYAPIIGILVVNSDKEAYLSIVNPFEYYGADESIFPEEIMELKRKAVDHCLMQKYGFNYRG